MLEFGTFERFIYLFLDQKITSFDSAPVWGDGWGIHFQPKKSEKLRESLKTKKNISLLIHILGAPALFWKVVRLLDE